jgi:hypothetical protein
MLGTRQETRQCFRVTHPLENSAGLKANQYQGRIVMTIVQTLGISSGTLYAIKNAAPHGIASGRFLQSHPHLAHFCSDSARVAGRACEALSENREIVLMAGAIAAFTVGAICMGRDVVMASIS